MDKRGKLWLWWSIIIVAILVVILLIIFLPSGNPPVTNPCEEAGNTCFENTCPENYAEVDLGGCTEGFACCEFIQSGECTSKGNSKGVGDPECCEGLKEVIGATPGQPANSIRYCVDCGNGICEEDERENWFDCPEDCSKSIIYGYVSLKEGNCMPPVGPGCTEIFIDTEIAIFTKVNVNDLDGTYYRPIIGPITIITSDSGYYEIELEPGEYSVFAKDPLNNNDYYCNSFGNEYACLITLESPTKFDIIIDHAVY
ncbi:MAG: hypothetical protein ABH817_02365 [archaeon]